MATQETAYWLIYIAWKAGQQGSVPVENALRSSLALGKNPICLAAHLGKKHKKMTPLQKDPKQLEY